MKAVLHTVLLALVIFGFVSCKQKDAQSTPVTVPTNSGAPVTKGKIVYVNIDSLMVKYNFYTESKNNLEGQIKNMQKEVEERAMAIQNEYVGYQKKGDNMTPVEMQAAQKSLGAKEQSLNAYKAKIEESIVKQQQQLDKLLKDKINVYLKQKALDNGYEYILSYTSAGIGMLYGDDKNDITSEVINELNALYLKEKK
jgi:outer membrane protein